MRYGDLYKTVKVSENLINKTLNCINFNLLEDDTAKAKMYNNISERKKSKSGTKTIRNNKVTFINNQNILSQFLNLSRKINHSAGWDFDIDAIEPLQYGEYHKGQEYGWHIDQHNTVYKDRRVRKISFSIFLNKWFTGGEFDLEIYGLTEKIDIKKRENLYLESNANGLLRKLQRFNYLKSLLRG